MAKKKELRQIAEYLLTLDKDILLFVLNLMSGGVHTDSAGCDPPCSGKGSTPNGHWVCSGGNCVWVPDIG